jgi:hypothetical protein
MPLHALRVPVGHGKDKRAMIDGTTPTCKNSMQLREAIDRVRGALDTIPAYASLIADDVRLIALFAENAMNALRAQAEGSQTDGG